jgi:hypothetical protein
MRRGRHFANHVLDQAQTLPYLTGFAIQEAQAQEMATT